MSNGFYGSLSKLQKINFQFDRIFPNRATMDQEAELGYYITEDGSEKLEPVLNGRYVLVDYHEGDVIDKTVRIGYKINGTIMAALDIPFGDGGVPISDGDIITVIGEYNSNNEYTSYTIPKMYRYPSLSQEISYTSGNEVSANYSTYEKNLIVDGQQYTNIGRGWDSTVWQKTYQGGKARYIMIAELNALSPAFSLGIDAPTVIPSSPYFGADSTINFYRLHMQPNWGMRVKRAVPLTLQKYINGREVNATYSEDLNYYPSDVIGGYDTLEGDSSSSPLAIYYNKKGFNKFISASNALDSLKTSEKTAINENGKAKNFISITPTGKSGKIYKDLLSGVSDMAPDMYELSIMLPSIGETISKIWDLIYGENRYYNTDGLRLYYKNPDDLTDQTASAFASKAENRGFRNIDTYWNSTQGLRAYTKVAGNKVLDHDALKTMAGTINSAHDLMGMIIRSYDSLDNVENWDPAKIYFVDGKYYIKNKEYNWTKYETNAIVSNADAYRQIYTLPTDIVSDFSNEKLYMIDEEPDQNGKYTKQFLVDKIPVIVGEDEGEYNIYSYLYRKTAEEYPEILDEETYDEDYVDAFKTGYNNYIKVKDSSDIIEGATYGFITNAPIWKAGQSQDKKEDGHSYYYYDTSKQYGVNTVCYIKDNDNLSAKKGIYYDLTDYANYQIDKPFYIPDVYYVKDNQTGLTRLATEATLKAITGNSQWEYSENGRYVFYKEAEPTQGTVGAYITDPIRQAKKRMEVPANRYEYSKEGNSGILTIFTNSNKTTIVERITNGTYYNQPLIEFSDLQEETPIYYYASMYLCDEGGYYTLDEISRNNLTKTTPQQVKLYQYWNPTGGTAEVLAGVESSRFSSLQDFVEGEYFYFYGGETIFVLENLERLKTSQGRNRSESLVYYRIVDFNARKKFFFSIGGSYYLTVEGDYKYYPALHLTDPNEANLTENGGPLVGETRILNVNFQEIPLEQCRWFAPNTYYIDTTGQQKVTKYTDSGVYYERIGNIIGDSEPKWPNGMEWNEESVPTNGILGSRNLTWTAKEIKGLGEDFNTMYGLILKTSQILQSDNEYIRDSNTIQGMINQCRDVLAQLEDKGYAYGIVNIRDKDGVTQTLTAQSSESAIKLKSAENSIELSLDGDEINLDLPEQYRKYVVPIRDQLNTMLSFLDDEENTTGKILAYDNKNVEIRGEGFTFAQEKVPTNPQTIYSGSNLQDSANISVFSGLSIKANIAEEIVSFSGSYVYGGNMPFIFTFYDNSNNIIDRIFWNGEVGDFETTYNNRTWLKNTKIAKITIEYQRSGGGGGSGNAGVFNYTITPLSYDLTVPINVLEVNNSSIKHNNHPLAYSETENSISFNWDPTEQIFTIYSDNAPIIQIKKQEN